MHCMPKMLVHWWSNWTQHTKTESIPSQYLWVIQITFMNILMSSFMFWANNFLTPASQNLSWSFKTKFEWKLTCPLIILLNMVLLSRNLISRSRKVNLLVLTWKWSLVNRTPEILKQSYHISIQIQCTSTANWKQNNSILHKP